MPVLFWLFVAVSLLFGEEPSAFGAGDINNPNPYGLSKTEQFILQNKKQIETVENTLQSLRKNHFALKTTVEDIKNTQEGFMSVAAGEISRINQLRNGIQGIDARFAEINASISGITSEYNQSVSTIRQTLDENLAIQNENIGKLSQAIQGLSKLIDTINANYVTGQDLQTLREEFSSLRRAIEKLGEEPDFSNEDNFKVYQDARDFLDKKQYKKAEDRFKWTADKKFKPAGSHFYLGQIAYATRRYSDAVYYYKTSVSLYDKADYMPELLIKTADSFEKIKDSENAIKFYESVMTAFPDSSEAKTAKENLARLKP